jgi:hypothetical protein
MKAVLFYVETNTFPTKFVHISKAIKCDQRQARSRFIPSCRPHVTQRAGLHCEGFYLAAGTPTTQIPKSHAASWQSLHTNPSHVQGERGVSNTRAFPSAHQQILPFARAGKRSLGRRGHRWQDNSNSGTNQTNKQCVDTAVVNTVTNIRVP